MPDGIITDPPVTIPIDTAPNATSRRKSVGISYVQLLNSAEQHVTHWTATNVPLGAAPLKLKGTIAVADLQTAITVMQTLQNAVTTANNSVSGASGVLRERKTALIPRITQFRKAVAGVIGTLFYTQSLPVASTLSANRARFTRPLQDIKDIWTRANADTTVPGFTPPLLLAGGYALANLTADLTALDAAYAAYGAAIATVRAAIDKRNVQMQAVLALLIQYREVIGGRYAATDAVYTSLPRLYPPRGGTPKPAENILYTYLAAPNTVTITFTPSTSANIDRYEARFSPGDKYDATNETIVAMTPVKGPFALSFTYTQVTAGDTGLFKVYVINNTDNEKGSKVLKIARPA